MTHIKHKKLTKHTYQDADLRIKITQCWKQSITKHSTHLAWLRNYRNTIGLTEKLFSLHLDTPKASRNLENRANRLWVSLGWINILHIALEARSWKKDDRSLKSLDPLDWSSKAKDPSFAERIDPPGQKLDWKSFWVWKVAPLEPNLIPTNPMVQIAQSLN